jgi:hypothetical protein
MNIDVQNFIQNENSNAAKSNKTKDDDVDQTKEGGGLNK